MIVRNPQTNPHLVATGARFQGANLPRTSKGVRSAPSELTQGGRTFTWVIGFLLLNMALAVVMKRVPSVATLHALVTFAVGLWLCLSKNRPLQVAQWASYVVGAEVLWRMCKASIPWEFAKLSISLVCFVSALRSDRFRSSWLPALYFVLLLPATTFSFVELPFGEARQQVSFNLSGPCCLAVCALWFSSVQLTTAGFQRIGIMFLGPIAGVGLAIIFGLVGAEVEFSKNSNFVASEGYGPNQISSMLALGAVLAVFLHLGEKGSKLLRLGFAVLALWLLAQAALTFSRTGVYLFGASFGVAAAFLVQGRGGARRLILFILVASALASAILPMLNGFTGGTLAERFDDKGVTGRDTIANAELALWLDKPVFGNGVGMSEYYRGLAGDGRPAHTEYTRLLAEHGLLGLTALAILIYITMQALRNARGSWSKAIVSGLAVWAFLFMAVTAMRLAAPAFLLGLIHARFLTPDRAEQIARRSRGLRQAFRAQPHPGSPELFRRLAANRH